MPLCLFCDAVLDNTTKPEHVLLAALGGRKEVRTAICSRHNNVFGGSIDNEFALQIIEIRNLLQLKSGTGNPAPALKKIQAGEHRVNIGSDGTIELAEAPFKLTKREEGVYDVQIRTRSERHFQEIIPDLAKAMNIPEDQLRVQLLGAQASIMSVRPGTVHHRLSFGGPDAIRSLVKSALVLWSTSVGNDEVKGAPYDAARQFVVDGDQNFNLQRTHLDSRFFENVGAMKEKYGPLFNLLYVRSDETGRVVGHFTLYNLIAWQFTLAESGGTPNRKIGLISNPLNPRDWTDRATEEFDVSFDWLNNPDYSDDMSRTRERFAMVYQHYLTTYRPQAIEQIVDDASAQLRLLPDVPLAPAEFDDLMRGALDRMKCYLLDIPYEQKLSAEEMAELVQKR